MAIDKIEMRYKGRSPGTQGSRPGTRHCSENRRVLAGIDATSLTLCYANPAFDVAAVAPADIRQGVAQYVLRARIHRDLHFAAVETGWGAGGLLGEKPHVQPLRRGLVDLTWVAESFLQAAHGLAHVVGGNARHRSNGVCGVAATRQSRCSERNAQCRDTQHNSQPLLRCHGTQFCRLLGVLPQTHVAEWSIHLVRAPIM